MMKIAIFNPYKKIYAAENSVDFAYEQIKKIDNISLEIRSFYSTEDIVKFNPDFILSHSSFTPKFCHIPTYVVFNESTSYRLKSDNDKRSYLTFDGYLTQSNYITKAIKDLCFFYNKKDHILSFANTRPKTESHENLNLEIPKLVYFANNWEVKSGDASGKKEPRFKELFLTLARTMEVDFLELYGDPEGWSWIENKKYIKGKVSFSDPEALTKIYQEKGVGLALSSHEFYNEDIANNRIYEIVSSGAVCIADDLPFYKEVFGDNLLYIDTRDEREMAIQIIRHFRWIKNNPKDAAVMAKNAHKIFCEKLCMEEMIRKLINFHNQVSQKNYHTIGYQSQLSKPFNPLVSVIVRSGGRAKDVISTTLDSIANQTYKNIQLVFVLYKENPEIENFVQSYKDKFSDIIIFQSSSNIRSTVMWEGLKKATGDYVALLDDDDIWYPNHLSKLLEFFDNNQDAEFVYSGRVYCGSEKPFKIKSHLQLGASYFYDLLYNLKSITNNESRYCLGGFGNTDYNELLKLNHPIHLCFLFKKHVLTQKVLLDPQIHHAEDLYFCALLYKMGVKFYWMPELTLQINIHNDNSSKDCDSFEEERVRDKLSMRIHGECSWKELLNKMDNSKNFLEPRIIEHKKTKQRALLQKMVHSFRDILRVLRNKP